MATVILDVTAFPQTFTSGNFPITTLNDGDWRVTATLTQASSNAAWGGGSYFALVVCNDLGGLWIYDDGGTRRIALFQNTSGSPLIVQTSGLVWNAGAAITIHVKNTTDEITISGTGLTSGAGTYAFTGSTTGDAFGTAPLGVGVYGGGGYTWAGSMSDIDDGVDGVSGSLASTLAGATTAGVGALAISGTLASTLAGATVAGDGDLAITGAGAGTLEGATLAGAGSHDAASGTGSLASTLEGASLIAEAATSRLGSLASTLAGATTAGAGALAISGALSSTLAGATVAGAGTGAGLTVEAHGVARALYGTAAGTRTVTLATSNPTAIVVVTGGNLSDLADAPTDDEANTYTALGSAEEFDAWPGYGIRLWACVGATGSATLAVSQEFGQTLGFDEATIGVLSVPAATLVQAYAMAERASATTAVAPAVSTTGPALIVGAWSGAAPTGATSVVTLTSGTILDVTSLVDHPNGYVPIAISSESRPSLVTGHAPTWGHTPTQGAIVAQIALQAAEGRVGTLAGTLEGATVAGEGDLAAAGSLASTLEGATVAGVGALAITGAGAGTLAGATTAGAGALAITGAGSGTLAGAAGSGAGSLAIAGGLTSTLEGPTLSAAGQLGGNTGALASTLEGATVAGQGALPITGAASPTLEGATLAGAGTLPITGAASATLAGATVAGIGIGAATILPRTFTVVVGVAAAEDFTVEVDP